MYLWNNAGYVLHKDSVFLCLLFIAGVFVVDHYGDMNSLNAVGTSHSLFKMASLSSAAICSMEAAETLFECD